MPATQIHRPFRLKTPLGPDKLLLESFTGQERMSTPYRFTLRVLCEDQEIDMKALLTKPVVLTIKLDDEDDERHIHGNIARVKLLQLGDDGMAEYEIEMASWLWFLEYFHDSRIFQKKSVKDIVEQVFKDRGFKDYRFNLKATYPNREYCVQYRESDLNFVSRLLEEEGIFYYFEQTKEKHILVLADQAGALAECPHQPSATFAATVDGQMMADTVGWLESECQVATGKASLTDYDFEKPNTDLFTTLAGDGDIGEYYDYPGGYITKSEGDRYARIRVEERELSMAAMRGTSNCLGFECGYKFKLGEHFRASVNGMYLVLGLEHNGRNTSHRSGSDGGYSYTNWIETVPFASTLPPRPKRRARKPVIYGNQTAVVTGKSGEEIWTDKYGRVMVQFRWDRVGKYDENSSCWIRVAQGWAGKQWGSIHIPRIGQEVVVSFLEGDPDRPLITGSVYNADQTVPYTLPDEMTKSTVKSNSTKGGGGFNEFRLEDKKGKEQIFLHAEKDLHLRVKDSRFENILNSTNRKVTKDSFTEIGGDDNLTVKGNLNWKVTGTVSLKADMDLEQKVGMKHALDAGQEIHLKAGMNVVIESGVSLTLKVGGNFININPAGVFIKGIMVFVNSGGSAGSGAGSHPEAPKAPTDADDAVPGKQTTPPPQHSFTPMKLQLTSLAADAKQVASKAMSSTSPAAQVLQDAANSGAPFCDI